MSKAVTYDESHKRIVESGIGEIRKVLFVDDNNDICFCDGGKCYRLSSYPVEPCLYIHLSDDERITVHNAFTIQELYQVLQNGGVIRMITGNAYDVAGVCGILSEAVRLNVNSVDIAYLEGCCVMRRLVKAGAVSERTAKTLAEENLENYNIMNRLIQSGQVCKTREGTFFVPKLNA